MLSAIEQTGKISIVKRNFSWGEDLALIIRTVERHFSDFNGNGFYPHPEEEALQRELLNVPTLRRLGEAIGREALRGMAITDLGLSHLSEAHRNAVLYAGELIAFDPVAMLLVLIGGLAYSAGAVFYALKRPNLAPGRFGFHELFHACTAIAFACQWTGILLVVLHPVGG